MRSTIDCCTATLLTNHGCCVAALLPASNTIDVVLQLCHRRATPWMLCYRRATPWMLRCNFVAGEQHHGCCFAVLSLATELFLNRVIYEMMSRVTLALIDNGAPNLKVQFQLIPLSSRRRRPNQQLALASSNQWRVGPSTAWGYHCICFAVE